MKNERDSLTRVNSSNPRTVLGVRIGAASEIVWDYILSGALPGHRAKCRIVGANDVDRHDPDTARRELRRSGVPSALQSQVFDLLEYSIRNRERVVSKDDLLAAVWHAGIVSELTLSTRMNAARSAIGVAAKNNASSTIAAVRCLKRT
jgi:Transcriptional regulatory protein, C terminal